MDRLGFHSRLVSPRPMVLLAVGCWIAGIIEFARFLSVAIYYFPAGINGDGLFYFAMGRGLLNGLHLYSDLFETKPPLIFWLAALSLWLGENDFVYRLIQAMGLALIPVSLAVLAVRLGRTRAWLAAGLAFLFGSAMASFAMGRSLGFQTEGFGIIPSVAALLIFVLTQGTKRRTVPALLGIAGCLTAAVLLKEPFALSILAGLLLLMTSIDDFVDLLKSIALSVVLWLAVLLLSGTAIDYFSLYLPEMLHGRVVENSLYHDYRNDTMFVVRAPLLLRGLNILRVAREMWLPVYDVVPRSRFLVLALGILLLVQPVAMVRRRVHGVWALLGAAAVALFVRLTNLTFVLDQLLQVFPIQTAWQDPFFRGRCLLWASYASSWIGLMILFVRRAPTTALTVAATCSALYLANVPVAAGGDFTPHHFLFAVPIGVAGFLTALRRLGDRDVPRWFWAVLGMIGGLLVLNALDPHRIDWEKVDAAKAILVTSHETTLPQARQLDRLLQACHYDRYFAVGAGTMVLRGLTVHSPYQLEYGLQRTEARQGLYFNDQTPHAAFREKLWRDFAETPIVVTDAQAFESFSIAELRDELRRDFTRDHPPCAEPFLPIPDLSLFFRSNAETPSAE